MRCECIVKVRGKSTKLISILQQYLYQKQYIGYIFNIS